VAVSPLVQAVGVYTHHRYLLYIIYYVCNSWLISEVCVCSLEIATGTDPDHSAVDVKRVPGTQAEEPAESGSDRGRTAVGTRVSGLHHTERHVPAAAPASLVLSREDNGQFFCRRYV